MAGFRVIDLTDGPAGTAGRFLAEAGADVILVEPPGGAKSRREHPQFGGHGLCFATTHFNKRGVVLDLGTSEGRGQLLGLLDGADLVLESWAPGSLAELGIGPEVMRKRNPRLVVVSVTGFGQHGPYRDWKSSELVLTAMSSALTRSGAPHREPLMPPGELASQTAAVHVAFVALLAVYRALRTGRGESVDCSLFDLVVQDFDPGLGMGGTATMGQPLLQLPPGRPDRRMLYPIVPCADGYVRMFVASAKQWRALFGWMGEPAEFADPSYEQLVTRFQNWDQIQPAIVELFADKSRAEIVEAAAGLGIAVASLNTAREILTSDHVRERNSFTRGEVAPELVGVIPNGYVEYDGQRAGFRHRAPELGEHTIEVLAESVAARGIADHGGVSRPLEGLRVLDLGVIVVGAETGRALADQGADVIKVENAAFMDGARQFDQPDKCGFTSAIGNRGKRSLGLDLRSARGRELFCRLVAQSDVVLTNFKPGTLKSLGLEYESLRAVNPRIIVVESSALGDTGSWSGQMGYGPLVRSTVGLTQLWRHPDSADAFGDDMTVYPDHAASRVGTAAIMAALIDRTRSGIGRRISVAQMETVFCHLAMSYLRESLEPGSLVARGSVSEFDAPTGLYRCRGSDAYCAIDVDGDQQWLNLAQAMSRADLADNPQYATAAGRVAHRRLLDEAVAEWTAHLAPRAVQDQLQAAGVACGAAVHVEALLTDPHLRARRQLGEFVQPGFDTPLPAELGPALFGEIPEPQLRPSPLLGADTRAVCRELLSLTDADVDELIAAGVLAE
ncbi:CaiB/BaiF CoA transferase family protein [Mycolicibacterium vanbaalenii]|uniref:CaiB/BaiF CoA transferase family protein n=1 Tax=Mycolicibacterium vanbaalenii TaxID=110539 RepID=UPI002355C413|nr:CoA transferase [Mycolicibacterium vanbaalenii]